MFQKNILTELIKISYEAGVLIMNIYNSKFEVNHKNDNSPVTNADRDAEEFILKKLNNMKLSEDANEIMKISLMTNAYLPKKNISEKDFLKLKSEWLIKNSDLDLIEEYLIKNQILFPPNFRHYYVFIF